MISNYTPAEYKIVVEYDLVFDDGHDNGFAFDCDENGVLSEHLQPEAKANYEWCLKHPERFERFNKVVARKWRIREDAHGICHCGNIVYLRDEYYGACQCTECGQWYNLSGQELLPPEDWQENFDEDY